MKLIRNRFLAIGASALCALAAASTSAQAATCVAGNWVSPPNTYWDSVNGAFPVQAESAHFQLRWPADKAALMTAAEAQGALAAMESILTWFTGPQVNWPEPFCDTAEKHKVQIFTNDGYGLSGAGAGPRSPAMWVAPNALRDVAAGRNSGMVHEFTHSMQYHSQGFRDSSPASWFWESHAEFMAHQYPSNPDKTNCSTMLAWMPHVYYGSTRNRYCNWQFWDHVKNNYGFQAINNIWAKSPLSSGLDPLEVLMKNQGWNVAALGDEFGKFAMRNVNWDYVDVQDGFNRGAEYRRVYGPNTDVGDASSDPAKRLRLAKVEPIDLANRRFVVSKYFAPQRYAYNLVRLVPDAGATRVTVNFRGVVQTNIAPGTAFGNGNAMEPGSAPDWTSFTMPTNPASNWRWGVVAIDQTGKSRASALQRGASGDLGFDMQPGDKELYLVVAATPDVHHQIFWDQMYYTLYRYPYKLQVAGAMPDGFQPGYAPAVANGWPAGRKHTNGGGWVASTARVDATAYVGPNAAVLGGQVLGNARVEDYAVVWNGVVRDTAVVGGLTQLNRNTTVADQARVWAVLAGGQTFDFDSVINGTTVLCGDLETHLGTTPLSSGAYCGFIDSELARTRPTWGANRTSVPTEATAVVPAGWPGAVVPPANKPPVVSLSAPAANARVAQGALVTLTASASDSDGTVARVEFYDGATLLNSDAAAPFSFTWLTTAAGARSLSAKAYDNKGAVTTSAPVLLNVIAPAATPPLTALQCARQNGTCSFAAGTTSTVWFGAGTSWAVRTGVSGSLACTTTVFGDPAPGTAKTCRALRN